MGKRKSASPVVKQNTGDDNLRRGNEAYALRQGVPQMLALRADFAEHALAEVEEINVPDHLRREITYTARTVLARLKTLQEHVDRGEIGQAVLAAMEVGLQSERIVRLYFQRDVERENMRKERKEFSVIDQQTKATVKQAMARELWNEYDASDIKKRGKKPIHKEIGEVMAKRLELARAVPPDTVRKYLLEKQN